jgi:hypothetical protein
MKALLALVPVTIFAAASCGQPTAAPVDGDDPSTQSGGGPARTCRPTCNTPADCATPGQPLQDASHYTCAAGRCAWIGCQSEQECQGALMSHKVTCAEVSGAEVQSCVTTCQAAADCAVPGVPMADAQHFTCAAGKCQWRGCLGTADCTAALGNNRVVCDQVAGSPIAACLATCTKAADCAAPGSKLNDATHFACKAGRCEWQGCKSSAECAADLHHSNVICE